MHEKLERYKKKFIKKHSKYKFNMCLAKLSGGRRCMSPSMKNGRCVNHGGCNPGAQPTHGRYSKHFKQRYAKWYRRFRDDPDILNLRDELALLRTILVRLERKMGIRVYTNRKGKKVIKFDVTKLTREEAMQHTRLQIEILDTIGKMAERIKKIDIGYFPMEAMPVILNQIVNILVTNLHECPHCNKSLKKQQFKVFRKLSDIKLPEESWKEVLALRGGANKLASGLPQEVMDIKDNRYRL